MYIFSVYNVNKNYILTNIFLNVLYFKLSTRKSIIFSKNRNDQKKFSSVFSSQFSKIPQKIETCNDLEVGTIYTMKTGKTGKDNKKIKFPNSCLLSVWAKLYAVL